jgi:peptidoglycan/LPS O-acetylase OafA/YrhL|tara:strand:- start:413 stop:739 length:327 start_codon:yes stop_codon:yes gene_type:complete
MKALIICSLWLAFGYVLAWILQAGQATWSFMKPPYPSLIFGIPTSMAFSFAAFYSFQYHPEAWFYKILSQFIGTVIFAVCTYFILGQSIDWKTGTAILLCFIAVLLQL